MNQRAGLVCEPPPPKSDAINPVAALRRIPGEAELYELIIRWFLGCGNVLPHYYPHDPQHSVDVFRVRVNVGSADGGLVKEANIKPRPLAMLDPPREPVLQPYPPQDLPLDSNNPDQKPIWMIAKIPEKDVDCTVETGQQSVESFGVCHLLQESHPDRAEWRIAHALFHRLLIVPRERWDLVHGLVQVAGSAENLCDNIARSVAAVLVRTPITARRFRSGLSELVTDQAHTALPHQIWDSFLQAFRARWSEILRLQFAALLTGVFRDEEFVRKIDKIAFDRESTRNQLQFRAMTGGHLIDFWCSPDSKVGSCTAGSRGELYPGSELVGLGTTFTGTMQSEDPYTPDDIKNWITGGGLLVQVFQLIGGRLARSVPLTAGPGDPAGDLDTLGKTARFKPGTFLLTKEDLARALTDGSSLPPLPPKAAYVNYDIVQTNPGQRNPDPNNPDPTKKKQDAHAFGWPTAEGAVEIIITPPDPCNQTAVAGFNVYGMWENAATARYFAAPFDTPSLDDLRTWLITRRYSDLRDLTAFPEPEYSARLAELRNAPPWEPVFRRLTPTPSDNPPQDEDKNPIQPIDPFYANQVVYRVDLRHGMAQAPTYVGNDLNPGWQASARWDPGAPVSSSWLPQKDRDGNDLLANPGHPQRYRFWVTSVDGFEQESAPVAVSTRDIAVDDPDPSLVFTPVRRATLLPPALKDPEPGKRSGHGITYERAGQRGRLTVRWTTPLLNQLGQRVVQSLGQRVGQKDEQVYENNDAIEARVVVLRRVLRTKVKDTTQVRMLGQPPIDPELAALPQWYTRISSLLKDQWHIHVSKAVVLRPDSGNDWSYCVYLDDVDEGYEHKALIGVLVSGAYEPFWAKNAEINGVPQRKRWSYDATNTLPVCELVAETPRASEVALTDSLPVANVRSPRPVSADMTNGALKTALPVLAPPGLSRDHILMRLLGAPPPAPSIFPQPAPTPWSDSRAILTEAQIAMIETALLRCGLFGNEPIKLAQEPTLAAARWILAASFRPSDPQAAANASSAPAKAGTEHQHPTIGFRGVFKLAWSYKCRWLDANPGPGPDQAEAIVFRVYSAAAPVGPAEVAQGLAAWWKQGKVTQVTVDASSQLPSVVIEVDAASLKDEDNHALAKFACAGEPALVRLRDGADAPFGNLKSIQGYDCNTDKPGASIQLTAELIAGRKAPNVGDSVAVYLFAGQAVWDTPAILEQATESHVQYLPIGGGPWECVAYWLGSVSAQGNESRQDDRLLLAAVLERSVEPPTPQDLRIDLPDPGNRGHVLDRAIAGEKYWLPAVLQDTGDLRDYPRLLVSWNDSVPAPNVVVGIRRKVETLGSLARIRSDTDEWDAIVSVARLRDGDPVADQTVSLLEKNWLRGGTVNWPADSPGEGDKLVGPEDGLLLANGVKKIAFADAKLRPAFIDYRRDNAGVLAMDGSSRYQYQLRSYVVLNAGLKDYLPSPPTAWTDPVQPQTPPFTITCKQPFWDADAALIRPCVRFLISIPHDDALAMKLTFGRADGSAPWFYRVQILRHVPASLRTDSSTNPMSTWIEVDRIRLLAPDSTDVLEIEDTKIERDEPDQKLKLEYHIITQQVRFADIESHTIERTVRASSRQCISVEVHPPDEPGTEIRAQQPILLKTISFP